MTFQWRYDIHCPRCNKKLAEAIVGIVRFVCPRLSCGAFVNIDTRINVDTMQVSVIA